MPSDPTSKRSVIGVWASASRQAALHPGPESDFLEQAGDWVQVSRLGNPLFNEVIVPMGLRTCGTRFRRLRRRFVEHVLHPELAGCCPSCTRAFSRPLAGLTAPRADLQAILLTGIPSGIVTGSRTSLEARWRTCSV